MNRRQFLHGGVAAAAALVATRYIRAAQPSARKPNIIYILADDLGYGDIGAFGQEQVHTPNLDKLAKDGLKLTNHYAGAPLCAPSRCVLMTGLHTGHARIRNNGVDELNTLAAGDTTVAESLQAAGYHTACIGKWGLGKFGTTGDPAKKGFDHFFGFLDQMAAHFYYPSKLQRDGEEVFIEENDNHKQGAYASDLFSEDALTFLNDHHAKRAADPFFLYLAYTTPHAELLVPQDSLKEYAGQWEEKPFPGKHYGAQPQPRAARAAMITRMDAAIGRLLEKLKALGMENDTLVIFTSDNGPAKAGGGDPAFFHSAGPLRGLKFDLTEGGIRVPMIARWPGKIAPGTTTDFACAFWDVFPTLAEIAGTKTPAKLDGISFLPTLLGKPAEQKAHEYLYWEYKSMQAVRFGNYKALRKAPGKPVALYDLSTDINEQTDLAAKHPDLVATAGKYMAAAHVDDPNWPLKMNEDAPGKAQD